MRTEELDRRIADVGRKRVDLAARIGAGVLDGAPREVRDRQRLARTGLDRELERLLDARLARRGRLRGRRVR